MPMKRKKPATAKRRAGPAKKKATPAFDPERIDTQAQLDAALAAKAPTIYLVGGQRYDPLLVSNTESAHVVARGSAHVVAWGSAHVEAWESAHVEAWGSAHVVARGSAHVEAWESAHVEASACVSVAKMRGHSGPIRGGVVISQPDIKTAEDWCVYYGVPVTNGVAVLYKALSDSFVSSRGTAYVPGTTVEAQDWDGGKAECGGGFHFSPHPAMAVEFNEAATRFVACPVALADMRSPKPNDDLPQKIKARRVCGPIVEVDRSANPIKKLVTETA